MQRSFRRRAARREGQAMLEYLLAFLALMALAAAGLWLADAFRSNGSRTLDLVSSEYP